MVDDGLFVTVEGEGVEEYAFGSEEEVDTVVLTRVHFGRVGDVPCGGIAVAMVVNGTLIVNFILDMSELTNQVMKAYVHG